MSWCDYRICGLNNIFLRESDASGSLLFLPKASIIQKDLLNLLIILTKSDKIICDNYLCCII